MKIVRMEDGQHPQGKWSVKLMMSGVELITLI